MNKKLTMLSLAAIGGIGILGVSSAFAADTIGTVTGKDGDAKDLVQIEAEVIDQDGSHLTIKDDATGNEYKTAIGPSWYSGTYETGDKIKIEGVETTGSNENDHNFQVTKINDTTLRESFEGKPAWAGQKNGSGRDQNMGQNQNFGNGQHRNQNFIDSNGDGMCHNQ